jgi:hypothetical protein
LGLSRQVGLSRWLSRPDPAQLAAAQRRLRDAIAAQRSFLYVRVEEAYREIELLPDGTIGAGASEHEQTWSVAGDRGRPVVRIGGPRGVVCQLEHEDTGAWRGHFLQPAKLQALLLPASGPVSFRPKISFYTTCMGRLHHLRLTMPANLRAAASYGNVEFVLLNYNSPDGLDDWVRSELAPQLDAGVVQYYKTTRPTKYDSSKAKNTAARLATGEIVCNLDADNWLGHGFAEHLAALFDAPRTIVRAKCPWGGVYGRIAVFRQDFLALGGHDESFRGYGFDDTDFINRARAAGFVDKRFAAKYALCLSHSNAERTEHMAIDQKTSRRENKLKSAQNIKHGILVANAGKAWGDEPVVTNHGELVAA